MEPPTGPSMGPYDYELLVIGGGSGGLAVAKEAAGFRRKVLLLDLVAPSPGATERVLGGSSLNVDAVRKFLQQASLLGKALQDSQKYGWRPKQQASHDWRELVEAVKEQQRTSSVELKRELSSCGVFYLRARGQLVGVHTVEVTDVSGRKWRLTAETLVIATGDRPGYPDFPGATEYCRTSEDLLSLPHPPGRTLVVGGTAEGLECAGFLSGLGMPVAVVPSPDLLPGFDRRMAQRIENHMLVSGVDFLYRCSITKVELNEAQSEDVSGDSVPPRRLRVTIVSHDDQTRQEDFDTVLLCVGRNPATGGVGLESAGVRCDHDSGGILVDESDRTSVDHVYAVGSVRHGRPSAATGLSVHAGTLLARRLYGGDAVLCDHTYVPCVVLTPLEYAACGLTEERANLAFGETHVEVYHSYYWPLEWTLPARDKNSCYVKVICHIPDQDRVVGVHVMGPGAGDILQGVAAAMRCGLTKRQLDAAVGVRPGSAQVLGSLTQTQRQSDALMLRGNC